MTGYPTRFINQQYPSGRFILHLNNLPQELRPAGSIGTVRIGIIGVGGIGGAYALALSQQHEVFLVARGEHLRAIQEHGLEVDGAWGHKIIKAPAAEKALPEWNLETVFLITKAHDALAALKTNAEVIDGLPIVLIQNGIDALKIAEAGAPISSAANKVAVGISMVGGYHLEPGKVFVTDGNPTFFGSGETPNYTAEMVAELLSEYGGISIPNLSGYQWTKLIINTSNMLPALTGLSFAEAVQNPILLSVLTAAMRETAKIGLDAGINYETIKVFSPEKISEFVHQPAKEAEEFIRGWAEKINVDNYGSTAQSVMRGKPTEIDYLSGAIIREAERIGTTASVNEKLMSLLETVIERGAPLESKELLGVL